jgi:4-hydroxy-tetrahydrodipicolinate synthase
MLKLEDLSGVLPALISPLHRDGTVDEPAVARLAARMSAGGVSGLVALGSTGEAASLDESARRRILSTVIAATAGRLPVICGVAQSHLAAAQREIQAAARLGAAGVLVTPPFYYPIDQATVLSFYRRLAEESPMPVMLYNIPQFTKVVAQPATVATLAHEGTIVGIKDSSRDFEYFEGLCIATRDLPKFRIFTGSETMLLPSLTMGAAGTICGAANVAPTWVVRICESFSRGDVAAARSAQDAVYQLVVALRQGVFPAGVKAACHLQGICEPWCAAPVQPLDDQSEAKLQDRLEAWGLLGQAVS